MSDTELRDQLMTLLLAGHETTATALAWTFDLLLRHPTPLRRLRDSLAGGRGRLPARDDRRVAAPAPGDAAGRPPPRQGARASTASTLPAGTDVTPAIWLTHTRADVYPEPFAFRPERFLDEAPDTYAWIPYGGGIRRCLGASFAEFEMRIVAARGADPLRPAQGQPDAGAGRPPQHHPLARATAPRSSSPPAARPASATLVAA